MKKYFTILLTSALLFTIGIGLLNQLKDQKVFAIGGDGVKIPFTAGLITQKVENKEEDKEFSEVYLEDVISFSQELTLDPKEEKKEKKKEEPTFSLTLDFGVTEFLLTDVKEEEEKRNQEIIEKEISLAEEAAAKQKAEEEAILKAKLEAEAKAKAEKEAKEKAEREAKEQAEREAKAKAEEEARAKAIAEARAKAEREANAKTAQQAQAAQEQQQNAQKAKTTSTQNAGEWMTFEATAYTPYCSGCSGITANGHNLRASLYKDGKRVVAVDRRLIPMGTTLEIKLKNGEVILATAQDTGGAIKGKIIDISFNTNQEAYSFGRQSVQVRVLK